MIYSFFLLGQVLDFPKVALPAITVAHNILSGSTLLELGVFDVTVLITSFPILVLDVCELYPVLCIARLNRVKEMLLYTQILIPDTGWYPPLFSW